MIHPLGQDTRWRHLSDPIPLVLIMTEHFDGTRRRFLQIGLTALACTAATPALAAMPRATGVKAIALHNLHTDERLSLAYWKNGVYSRPALARINHILRDHRSGEIYPMNLKLIDLLYDLQSRIEHRGAVEIISGYRAPRTNRIMASASNGVARHSYHTKGMALDIRLSGASLAKLRNTALDMRRGGVGYYPDSEFVHVDVGPVRKW